VEPSVYGLELLFDQMRLDFVIAAVETNQHLVGSPNVRCCSVIFRQVLRSKWACRRLESRNSRTYSWNAGRVRIDGSPNDFATV
jgi:hypothetical protein